jgi:hypothetical protein
VIKCSRAGHFDRGGRGSENLKINFICPNVNAKLEKMLRFTLIFARNVLK